MHRFTGKLVNENGSAIGELCYKSKIYDSIIIHPDIYIGRDNGVCDRMSITKVKNSPENWRSL